MRLVSFQFKDLDKKWYLENINFTPITLIVGASGVGKTKILKSLFKVRSFALGEDLENCEWNLVFDIDDSRYQWTGKYVLNSFSFDTLIKQMKNYDTVKSVPNFATSDQEEQLTKIDLSTGMEITIFSRNKDRIEFMGNKDLPKLASDKSCLELFSNEKEIENILQHFLKIFFFDFEQEKNFEVGEITMKTNDKSAHAFEILQTINIPVIVKLSTAYKYFLNEFEKIKNDFMDIFPTVKDIRFKKQSRFDDKNGELEPAFNLEIQEANGVWVKKNDISSGMLKSLLYISLIYLSPVDSVMINDEFENSLGINCIDIVTDTILTNTKKQVISTSHHPYIINNIHMANWVIISRKGNTVYSGTAKDYDLGASKHDAFKQLINLPVYYEGSEDE